MEEFYIRVNLSETGDSRFESPEFCFKLKDITGFLGELLFQILKEETGELLDNSKSGN